MHSDYAPELDVSPFLDEEITNFYQSQVSILRWMVELGHLDLYIYIYIWHYYLHTYVSPDKVIWKLFITSTVI
jgi:hypothetical protein